MLKVAETTRLFLYRSRLQDWAKELSSRDGIIVAISRKGPRLLELLMRDGILPRETFDRVISERALPFLNSFDKDLIIVDDSMIYGSTFFRVVEYAKTRLQESKSDKKIIGLPFAMGDAVGKRYRDLADNYYLSLSSSMVTSFVNDEIQSFRQLGKPYDIEHPILTFKGDFSNEMDIDILLSRISKTLQAELTEIPSYMPTAAGDVRPTRWTMLLDKQQFCLCGGTPELAKIRIFLNSELDKLTIAPMCPCSIVSNDIAELTKIFPSPLRELWNEAAICAGEGPGFHGAVGRSKAMLINFLREVMILKSILPVFVDEATLIDIDLCWQSLSQDDLRLLLGERLARKASEIIRSFLSNETDTSSTPPKDPIVNCTPQMADEIIPENYKDSYKSLLAQLLGSAFDVGDVMKAIFYAQHRAIEIKSRDQEADELERLEFGIRFPALKKIVQDLFPDTSDIDIHCWLDTMIDNGCIVPRYIDMGGEDGPVWVRVFRIGEGSVPMTVHTICLLHDKLAQAIGSESIPAVLFEKFCVLVLSVATDEPRLLPIQCTGLRKGFHLYGAREMVMDSSRNEFLLDWASKRKILNCTGTDEVRSVYQLFDSIENTYPISESPWNDDVRDAVEDISLLAAKIHSTSGLKDDALVTLTSIASESELHKALEAELHLWLHDGGASVYRSIRLLSNLVDKFDSGNKVTERDLEIVNITLVQTARFTAQVRKKLDLAEKRLEIYSHIEKVVQGDRLCARVWKKLHGTLSSRLVSETQVSGKQNIISALRVAYSTNRILRNLLGMAGRKDARNRTIEKSVNLLRATLSDSTQVDQGTQCFFRGSENQADVDQLLKQTIDPIPTSFPDAFRQIRPALFEIAERCEAILREFGSEEHREQPRILEPPKYILMWDVRGSTNIETRDDLEKAISTVCSRLQAGLEKRIMAFAPDSKDDGNGFVCQSFTDVVSALTILNEGLEGYTFRAGVDVNLQGRLNYYPRQKTLGGRAYEFAARTMTLFKEVASSNNRWSGGGMPDEPKGSYVVVGEFARRYAEKEDCWPPHGLEVSDLSGMYLPRVTTSFKVSASILTFP